jgi:chromosome segregation ATPase
VNSKLKELQNTVYTLKNKLSQYDSLSHDVAELKSLINDEELGLKKSLNYVAEQSESNYDEVYNIRRENAQLRSEVDLLRATMIKMDRKITHQEKELNDLRSRSTRDNILIHNYEYTPGENLSICIPKLIQDLLGVQVSFETVSGERTIQDQ